MISTPSRWTTRSKLSIITRRESPAMKNDTAIRAGPVCSLAIGTNMLSGGRKHGEAKRGKGLAVSGSGRGIERLEISVDRCKSWLDVSINQTPGKCYASEHKKPACVSFEATIDVSETIEIAVKEMKIRAMVKNIKPVVSSERDQVFVPDMIRSIFERLNFAEFHKARSISRDWYSTPELCMRQNPTPWLILFPQNDDFDKNHISCKLCDPHHWKMYRVRDLRFDFHKSRCLANSGSWFLMLDHRTNFCLLNVFTQERILLPTLEAIDGWQMKFERVVGESDFLVTEASGNFSSGITSKIRTGNAILWVDERSRDYLVLWNHDCFFAYHRKGDSNKSWKVFEPLKSQGCVDMVYKESKLYVLSTSPNITVFDFSDGDSPKECASFPSPDYDKQHFYNLGVTLSGEVLIIAGKVEHPEICYFDVYKMDPESSKWTQIYSIGNEALFLDIGTTVAAKDGIKENCVYFSNDQFHRYNEISLCYETSICVYNIQNDEFDEYDHFRYNAASSPMPFKDARWFFPTFGGKWLL